MEIMEIFIAYLALAFICYWLAGRKNRNKVRGFFAGFFFGIVAVCYYLLVGKLTLCRYCKEALKHGAVVCSKCGREQDEVKK